MGAAFRKEGAMLGMELKMVRRRDLEEVVEDMVLVGIVQVAVCCDGDVIQPSCADHVQ